MNLANVIPGGIRSTDFRHILVNDGTCSRCRQRPPEEDVPLMLWMHGGLTLLIYCETCLRAKPEPPAPPVGAHGLSLWTVYDRPSDFPNCIVARRHEVTPDGHGPTGDLEFFTSLENVAERFAAAGFVRLPRQPDDDPVIVETWL